MENRLKAIYVRETDVVLVFDDAYQIVSTLPEIHTEPNLVSVANPAEYLQTIIQACGFTEEERAKVLNMTVQEFCDLCTRIVAREEEQTESEDEPLKFNAPKMVVLAKLDKFDCPNCHTRGNLRVIDGILSCARCGYEIGDVDTLPDII